ncbi:hypothetical protein C8J56DRAFT_918446 [Mycena floridula]|nr:hypothetical protein C8J56DRAFT_918446 [Mycena floridula]
MPGLKQVHFATPGSSYGSSGSSSYGSSTIPLPPIAPTEIHPLLATQAFRWSLLSPAPQTSVQLLAECATNPPLPSLEIICDFLPWRLKIVAQRLPYVTIGDVLSGIHYNLNRLVTEDEFNKVPTNAIQRQITEAFVARCKLDPRSQQTERAKGLKRVDFLMKNVTFLCLSSSSRGPSTFRLHVS